MDIFFKKTFADVLNSEMKNIRHVGKLIQKVDNDCNKDIRVLKKQISLIESDVIKLKQHMVEVTSRVKILGLDVSENNPEENTESNST